MKYWNHIKMIAMGASLVLLFSLTSCGDGRQGTESDKDVMDIMEESNVSITDTSSASDTTENVNEWDISTGFLIISDDGTYRVTGSTESYNISIASGNPTVILDNVNIDLSESEDACAFLIGTDAGNVTVKLAGTNTLTSSGYCAGLQKDSPGKSALTITSLLGDNEISGELKATGGKYDGSGIGGGKEGNADNITIAGGTIEASSGSHWSSGGAGIGPGSKGTTSNITISGGNITAMSRRNAGIGGGDGNITVSGGTVSTTGGANGYGGIRIEKGCIDITGGSVNATGPAREDNYGDAISGGDESVITISGGNVNATGYGYDEYYAGYQGGNGIIVGNNGKIIISDGTIVATGDRGGTAIGCEQFCTGVSITISGGNVLATAEYGAGIGASYKDNDNLSYQDSTANAIEISGGMVTASGAVGLGTRDEHPWNISINPESGCQITAQAGDNASGSGAVNVSGSPFSSKQDITNFVLEKAFFRSLAE